MKSADNVIAFLSHAVQPRTLPQVDEMFESHRLREAASAAERGDLATLVMLKEQGADLDEVTSKDVTLLMYALAKNDEIAVRTLLTAGANPNTVTKVGMSAMLVAATKNEPRWLATLLDHGGNPKLEDEKGETLVHQAISLGAFNNLGVLFQAGVPVDVKNAQGQTPALRLAYLNQYQDVFGLLDQGADPTAKDKVGVSIQKLAARPLPNPNSPLEAWRIQVAKRLGITVD